MNDDRALILARCAKRGRVRLILNKAVTETEIKLRVEHTVTLRSTLDSLGWQTPAARELEQNWVYDRPDSSLSGSGYLLRVRQVASRGWLTVKGPVRNETPHPTMNELRAKRGGQRLLKDVRVNSEVRQDAAVDDTLDHWKSHRLFCKANRCQSR